MKEHLGVYYDKSSDFQQLQFQTLRELIAEVVPVSEIRTLLDIGCGTGSRTRQLLDIFPNASMVTAIEPDREMLEVATEKYADPRITYKQMGAEDLSALAAEGGAFDDVLSHWVLHWVENKEKMLADLSALTPPGGWFVFSTCQNLPVILQHVDTYVRTEFRVSPRQKPPYFYLTESGWRDLLTRHGWTVKAVRKHEVWHDAEFPDRFLDHWFTASAGKCLYGKHIAEMTPLARSDLVWSIGREFPSFRYEGGLSFAEDVLFIAAQRG